MRAGGWGERIKGCWEGGEDLEGSWYVGDELGWLWLSSYSVQDIFCFVDTCLRSMRILDGAL